MAATHTPNLNLNKPDRQDFVSVVHDINDNMEKIDEEAGMVDDGIAIVIDGNTAPRAISAGKYLLIKNHSTLATGGYHATANIANGESVTSSNVAADSDGIANALNSNIAPLLGLGNSASRILQIIVINTKGTLGGSFAAKFAEMSDDGELRIFKNSNAPSDAPSDNQWGGALILKIDSTTGVAFSFSNTYFGYSRIENGAIAGWIKLS